MTPLFQQISETIGILPNSLDENNILLAWANRAGKLLFDGYDLPGTVIEQFFCYDTTQHVISLPWYVGSVRGIRLSKSSRKVALNDMRPRYNVSPWTQPLFKFRQLAPSPLSTGLTQSGTLTFVLSAAETFPVNITVIGQTATASRVVEILTFNVGDTSKTTVNQWSQEAPFGITALKKDVLTSSDVQVLQTADSLVVGTIANTQLEAQNIRVQVLDWNLTQSWNSGYDDCLEVLYKKRYTPFVSIDDSWIDERLDQALVYAVKYLWAVEKGKGDDIAQYQGMYMSACESVCTNMEASQEILITMEPDGASNASIRAPFWPLFYTYDRY
jgi:hypothetical protein